MQKTDFPFEFVIGEDCSPDKTREICFEYQKKYPDKIRVLWSEKNLYRNPHPAGGNGARTTAHCRGEFIAFCEGDDYWTDPLKLQKQVDVMRAHPEVSLCFCGAEDHDLDTGTVTQWNRDGAWGAGLVKREDFIHNILLGKYRDGNFLPSSKFIRTASVLLRRELLNRFIAEIPIAKWNLMLGDLTTWVGVAHYGDVYFLPDCVSVYNIASTGACRSSHGAVDRDAELVAIYYAQTFDLPLTRPERARLYSGYGAFYLNNYWRAATLQERRAYCAAVKTSELARRIYHSLVLAPAFAVFWSGVMSPTLKRLAFGWWKKMRGY